MMFGYKTVSIDIGTIGLDGGKCDILYTSHAHTDHIRSPNKKKGLISSKPTSEMTGYNVKPTNYKDIKLFSAGHVLGSTQIAIETDGNKIVYTGDFKLKKDLTNKPAEIKECDTLIIESTYGGTDFQFPDREDVYDNISKWVKNHDKDIILFGGYALGKSQEIIKVLNDYCDITPIVDQKIEDKCKTYDKFGVKLNRVVAGSDEALEMMRHEFTAVMPQRIINRSFGFKLGLIHGRKVSTAVTTGQTTWRHFDVDKTFLISDHADQHDIETYIEQANPKKIYTCHGNEVKTAHLLSQLGYNVSPYSILKGKQQHLFSL